MDQTKADQKLHLYSGEVSPFLGKGFSDLSRELSKSNRKYLSFYERGKLLTRISFSEYFSLVAGLNEKIRPYIKTGDMVIVAFGNSLESFIAYGSILSLGATIVPVDPKEGIPYFQEVIRCTKSRLLLGNKSGLTEKEFTFQYADLAPGIFQDFNDNDPASLFFTSGTTGQSKGVIQRFSSFLANLEATKRAGNLSENDHLFTCLPVYHVNAFNFSFLLPMYLQCEVAFCSEFPMTFWKILNDEKVTVASLAPPVIRLINADARNLQAPESLNYFISASSPIYKEDLERMSGRFGVRILQAYGLSETVNFTLFNPTDLSVEEYRKIHLDGPVPSAGVPTYGNDVQILSSGGELITSEDQEGEIVVRGWSVHTGYFDNEAATKEVFQDDYFHTGDIAYFRTFTGRRFFYITGRKKEVVKRKGKLVYLSEIDGVIKSIGLKEACAVGFPNSHTDEEIGLFLVKGSTSLSHEQILAELQKILHPGKRPKVIVEGDAIPVTSVGKIKRNLLKDFFFIHRDTRFRE